MGKNIHICVNGEWKVIEGYSKDGKWYANSTNNLISNEVIHWIADKTKTDEDS